MDKNPSCEDRIASHLESALEDLERAGMYQFKCEDCDHEFYTPDDDPECPECESLECEQLRDPEETHEQYMEGVLEITPLYTVYRVGLSYGGPADGFTLYCDPETGEIEKAEYYFQDWFDGARRGLSGDALEMVKNMFQHMVES